MEDTIFAQASARGRAGVSIFRISGPRAFAAAKALAGAIPPPRQAGLRWLMDPGDGERIDQGLLLAFPGPASFTGEDVVELQVHGSPAVNRALTAALGNLAGLRQARPGEFTRRALQNGRVDLPHVEGLADLLAAETLTQRRQALAIMSGAVSQLVEDWRSRLTHALAFVEVGIDFSDEELPDGLLGEVGQTISSIRVEMNGELQGSIAAERIRDGFEVALVGQPNVGKSTLLNALARRDAALTSDTAGTTRDVIEVRLDVQGLPVTLLDMAGLRDAQEPVEAAGVARARARAAAADLRVFLVNEANSVAELGVEVSPGDLEVLNKADRRAMPTGLAVSGTTGAGIAELLARIAEELLGRIAGSGSVAHARQRAAIAEAAEALASADQQLRSRDTAADLVAEDLRAALRSLDLVVGRVNVESVLDEVFAGFCLGK